MQLVDLTWPAIKDLNKDTPVVIPVAALEQHGHHLPLFTDSLLLGEVVRRVSDKVNARVLFAPLTWLGNSDHHLDFPGTLSASPRSYLDLLNGLIENFIQHGFRRIIMINGHGGNSVPGQQALFEVRQRHRDRSDLLLLFSTYWDLADPARISSMKLRQNEMGHACEWETSMIMRIAPHLVREVKNLQPVEAGIGFAPATRGWITKERTTSGHLGHPAEASAEKGEALLQIFSDGFLSLLERALRWDGKGWNG